ncbi:MAG: histone deacetylase [Chloroflexi bacterium]|nr:histone deacetylase [Chloroflexota bacterium]
MSVAYVYDARHTQHREPGHPERPERLIALWQVLEASGLLPLMTPIEATPVDPALLHRIHDRHHIEAVKAASQAGGGHLDSDTYITAHSYEIALLAAGGAVNATEAVLSGKARAAFTLLRPPGHHALSNRGMGFCLFNHIALAAQHALERGLERILIIDYDAHHGNGTQEIFYPRADVLYFSTHQYPWYPGSGHWRERGEGPGEGHTANVPLPAGIGDQGYLRVFREILSPLAERYRPQLILVSAGYDAHWRDPLALMRLSARGFAELAIAILDLAGWHCDGKCVFVLEGGYDLDATSASALATFAVLLERPVQDLLGEVAPAETPLDQLIADVQQAHHLGSES